jgi:hypothetical protein
MRAGLALILLSSSCPIGPPITARMCWTFFLPMFFTATRVDVGFMSSRRSG